MDVSIILVNYNTKELTINCIKSIKDSYDFDYSINIEAVPAESANVKLCYKDNILYPEKDRGYFIFSNQWIPLMQKCTLQEKIRLGSVLDKACEGGVIAHINLAGEFADEEQAWKTRGCGSGDYRVEAPFCVQCEV